MFFYRTKWIEIAIFSLTLAVNLHLSFPLFTNSWCLVHRYPYFSLSSFICAW